MDIEKINEILDKEIEFAKKCGMPQFVLGIQQAKKVLNEYKVDLGRIDMFDNLMQTIEYAKTSIQPQEALYEAYGKITMAYELKAINKEEYLKLNEECVADGINNPKYF